MTRHPRAGRAGGSPSTVKLSVPTLERSLTAPARTPRPVVVLEVLATERLTDHLVRVHAGGPGFAGFTSNDSTDKYVKIHFAKPHLGLDPPYDITALRETLPPEDLPVTRTYTVRSVGEDRLSIDFVVHGDIGPAAGIAGPWAASAQPGDRLVVSGPGGGYAPDPAADAHLLAGDESAVPAVASALEARPARERGRGRVRRDVRRARRHAADRPRGRRGPLAVPRGPAGPRAHRGPLPGREA